MKFPMKNLFSKCNQIGSFLQIWSPLLKKLLMINNFNFCSNSVKKDQLTITFSSSKFFPSFSTATAFVLESCKTRPNVSLHAFFVKSEIKTHNSQNVHITFLAIALDLFTFSFYFCLKNQNY